MACLRSDRSSLPVQSVFNNIEKNEYYGHQNMRAVLKYDFFMNFSIQINTKMHEQLNYNENQ